MFLCLNLFICLSVICVYISYENAEVALNCGMMLRECFRHEELAKLVLMSDSFYKFFDYVELSTFDIASDAFSTFKVQKHVLCVVLMLNTCSV